MSDIDRFVRVLIDKKREDVEDEFDADVISYYGPIGAWALKPFRLALEGISSEHKRKSRIAIVLNTGTLTKVLRLEIDDYTELPEIRKKISNYHDIMVDNLRKNNFSFLLHARNYLGA